MQPVISKSIPANNITIPPDIPKGPVGAVTSGQALLLPEWRKQSIVFQSGAHGSHIEGSSGILLGAQGGLGPK